jgi:hypothetical protein
MIGTMAPHVLDQSYDQTYENHAQARVSRPPGPGADPVVHPVKGFLGRQ